MPSATNTSANVAGREDVDRHALLAEVGERLDVRVRLGVPVDDLRVDLERGDDRQHRRLVVAQDLALGVGVAEVDAVVGVLLDGHRLVADGRAAGADLDVDAGLLAAGHERAAHDLLARCRPRSPRRPSRRARRARPRGTSRSGSRAGPGRRRQVDRAAAGRAAGRPSPVLPSPSSGASVVVAADVAVVAVARRVVVAAAGARGDACGATAPSERARVRFIGPPRSGWVDRGVIGGGPAVSYHLPMTRLLEPAEEQEHGDAEQRGHDHGGEQLLAVEAGWRTCAAAGRCRRRPGRRRSRRRWRRSPTGRRRCAGRRRSPAARRGTSACAAGSSRLACCSVNRSCMPAVGRLQPEQRVHDDREQRDDHAHDDPGRLAGAAPERDQRRRWPGSGSPAASPCTGRWPARTSLVWLISTAMRDAEHDRDGQPDERHPGARPQRRRGSREKVVPVEEAVLRRPRAAAAAGTGAAASSTT